MNTSTSTDNGVLLLMAATELHPGSDKGGGLVDKPVSREHNTRLPVLHDSALRGALRAAARPGTGGDMALWTDLFGPEAQDVTDGAALLGAEEGRLLAWPVPAQGRAFVWVSSPFLLLRFAVACELAGVRLPCSPVQGHLSDGGLASWRPHEQSLCLADLRVPLARSAGQQDAERVVTWARWIAERAFARWHCAEDWRRRFEQNVVIVDDARMQHLAEQGMVVKPRIQRSDDGQAENLWFEERIPQYALFFGEWSLQPSARTAVLKREHFADIRAWLEGDVPLSVSGRTLQALPRRFRAGGLESLGKGWLMAAPVQPGGANRDAETPQGGRGAD